MAFRFTNTDKWNDSWFSELSPESKLLFIYLYENCDIAGFIEVNKKRWAVDIGMTLNKIEGALEGLSRGLRYSISNDCIYIINYLKHQKNYPLNLEKNPAHKGIYKRFELYSFKFNISNIFEFIEAPTEGLRGGLGNGNGNGNGNFVAEKKQSSVLMKNSNITIDQVKESFNETDDIYMADFKYYYNCALDWSNSGNNKKTDWIATVRNFARRDLKDGKMKILNGMQQRNKLSF